MLYSEIVERLKEDRLKLYDILNHYDNAKTDYYHLFEFGNFPDDVLLEIHREYSNMLQQRREIKRQLEIIKSVLTSLVSKANSAARKQEAKTYAPRVLTQEFTRYATYIQN